MMLAHALQEMTEFDSQAASAEALSVEIVSSAETGEVLAFLAERPLHTVNLVGCIRDNGVLSPLNRGTFYACRNEQRELQGVALIGHATLFEARTEAALIAFAQQAQQSDRTHMVMGEQKQVEHFWRHYSEGGLAPRIACRELLFELNFPVAVQEPVAGLRLATREDLDLVLPVQAEMAFAESGVNPLEVDPQGFRARCARRIDKGRTWVLVADGLLIFKAEVMSETAAVVYLEGVYVNAALRGNDYGTRCLSQLSRTLLCHAGSVCLLVNEQNRQAHRVYQKVGYKQRGYYESIFL